MTTVDHQWVTRREFDLLAGQLARTDARLETMDANGTRGVGVIQTQQIQIVKDMSDLKADMIARFALHERVHEQDEAQRRSRFRWALGLAVAVFAAIEGPLGYLIAHLH